MHQMVSTIYYFFWVRYHPSKVYSQKKSWQETKYRLHFPSTTKPHLLNPLDRGPTSLVLARYRLVVLRPFCACFTIFYFCLLSFPCCFCHSKLDLFRSAACFCLISSRVSCCVCHFLRFGFSFLHVISATDISCCSLFLFIVLLHISFHAYLFIQKDLDLCGPNNVDWIKKVLGQFVFICQSHSAEELYSATDLRFVVDLRWICILSLDLSCSSVFLVSLWALIFIGLSSS